MERERQQKMTPPAAQQPAAPPAAAPHSSAARSGPADPDAAADPARGQPPAPAPPSTATPPAGAPPAGAPPAGGPGTPRRHQAQRPVARRMPRPETRRRHRRPARRRCRADGAPCAAHGDRTVAAAAGAASLDAAPGKPAAAQQGPRRLEDFRGQRREVQEGGRTVITEPGRVIIRDPSGESFVRHDESSVSASARATSRPSVSATRHRTIVVRPDGSQIITVLAPDGRCCGGFAATRAAKSSSSSTTPIRDPRAVGGFYVDLPPPVIRIPYDRYIVDAADAPPDLIYETMEAPPVDRIDRRYTLDEIRYSPNVRMLMPSIDVNTINFESRLMGDPARPGREVAGDRRRPQPCHPAQSARGVPDRGSHRRDRQRHRQPVAVGSPRRIRRPNC